MRWSNYPLEDDFKNAVAISRRYGFCEVGRLVTVLLTSIYMIERRTAVDEKVHLLRHIYYFGALSPFTACSPRAASAIESGLFGDGAAIEAQVDTALARSGTQGESRWWIKRLHWRLRLHERNMKIKEWLGEVRSSVRLSGNSRFLSGIDWSWVDTVIKVARIKPFEGDPDGVYVLLLRAMEERQREPNPLKLALAPLAPRNAGLDGLVKWLIQEYGADTTAFIRFFLTPAMILKMKLETSYTAALSERLNALDSVVSTFGLDDDVMTAEQYAYEQRALTTTLTFMTVGAAQFEVSWDAFRSDAQNNAIDQYRAYMAFNKTYNALPLLTDAKKVISHVFGNKHLQLYEFRNRDWPLVSLVCEVVDTFLSHPSYGIEAILAIRIRHDNIRRELAVALGEVRRTTLSGVSSADKKACLQPIETALHAALQSWIDRYMHTRRTDAPTGLFDFIPTQSEMEEFVDRLRSATALDEITDHIVNWVRHRLEANLETAREKLSGELKPALLGALWTSRDKLINSDAVGRRPAESITAVAEVSIARRVDELIDWFNMPSETRRSGLSYKEMKLAIEGRFSAEVRSGVLEMSFHAPSLGEITIPPEEIRHVFDLWSELTTNAIKYSSGKVTRLRVREKSCAVHTGLMFSSQHKGDQDSQQTFDAEPNVVADEAMLRKGKSGFRKVAALSAAVTRTPVKVEVVQRRRGFHVFVPLAGVHA
jgi:hypothetical protein